MHHRIFCAITIALPFCSPSLFSHCRQHALQNRRPWLSFSYVSPRYRGYHLFLPLAIDTVELVLLVPPLHRRGVIVSCSTTALLRGYYCRTTVPPSFHHCRYVSLFSLQSFLYVFFGN